MSHPYFAIVVVIILFVFLVAIDDSQSSSTSDNNADLPVIIIPLSFAPKLRSIIFIVRLFNGNTLFYESIEADMLFLGRR